MNNRTKIGVRIEVQNTRFFYSNDRLVLTEVFGGDERKVFFQPALITTDLSDSALSFEGSAPVQTLTLTVSDGFLHLQRAFENNDYEQAVVYVYQQKEDGIIERFLGSLNEVNVQSGQVNCVIRFTEELANPDYLEEFSHLTFQKYESLVPSAVGFQGNWQPVPDVPWQVYATEFNRTTIKSQPKFGAYRETGGKLNGKLVPQVSRVLLSPDVLTDYIMKYNAINTSTDINPDTVGNDRYLERDLSKAFYLFRGFYSGADGVPPTTFPTEYYHAFIGPGHKWTNDNSPELIRYAFFGEGYFNENTGNWVQTSGKFWLSGIPHADKFGVYTAASLDPISLGAPWDTENEFYTVKKIHNPGDIIAPARDGAPNTNSAGCDYIWFKANGLVPDIDDADFGAGFLFLGKTYRYIDQKYLTVEPASYQDIVDVSGISGSGSVNPNVLSEYKVFHRYKIVEIVPDVYDYDVFENTYETSAPFTLIKVAIQDHPLDDESHPYAVKSLWMANGYIDTSVDEENPVEIYTYEYMLSYMDLLITDLSNEEYAKLSDINETYKLKDRYRGLLLSQFEDFQQFRASLSNSNYFNQSLNQTGQIESQNANLIDNATEKFAVIAGSEILYGDDVNELLPIEHYVVERLYFHVPDVSAKGIIVPLEGENDADVVEGTITGNSVQASRTRDKIFSNYLTYKPNFVTATDQLGLINYKLDEVQEYFLSSRYRIIYDPVPENSGDLGKYFPIVYGYANKVPLLQTISKKTLFEGNETAGDDYYVYACHPCNISSALDITLEFVVDYDSKTYMSDTSRRQIETSSLKDEFAKSPFPKVEYNHYFIGESDVASLNESTSIQINKLYKIYSPYHRLENKITNDNKLTYGIQLRGNEWDYRLGRLDKRYPVRNGLGNSTLYGTFSGWVDTEGKYTGEVNSVIVHPIDIIRHFIEFYGDDLSASFGRTVSNRDLIDEASAEFVKSKTRHYEATVYISDQIKLSDLIDSLCRQFGIYWFIYGHKIYFSLGEIDFVNYDKPVAERLNLIKEPVEEQNGYKDIYTEIIYNYNYDYIKGAYANTLNLTKFNNEHCSKAAKAKVDKKEMVVDGIYQNKYAVAKEVANKYAKYFSSKRITYDIEVKRELGVNYLPGEVIPLTYSRFNMNNVPVLIISVKDNKDSYLLKVVRFPDIEEAYVEEPIDPPVEPPIELPYIENYIFWYKYGESNLWQDTGKTTPAVTTGDPIAVIEDYLLNGKQLDQSNAAYMPKLHSDNSIYLDGSDFIRGDNLATLMSVASVGYTVHFKLKWISGLGLFSTHTSSSGINRLVLFTGSGTIRLIDSFAGSIYGTDPITTGNEYIVSVSNDMNGNIDIYLDGVLQINTTIGDARSFGWVSFGQEWDSSTPSDFITAYYKDIVIYDYAQDSTEVTDVYNYLSSL